jgi:hypothetical protein
LTKSEVLRKAPRSKLTRLAARTRLAEDREVESALGPEVTMSRSLAEIEEEELQLSEQGRATLAEHLLHCLMPGEDADAENE